MKKVILFSVVVLLFMFAQVGIIEALQKESIYVPDSYSTIQEAVNAASSGDTIIIKDGTYTENVIIDKDHLIIKSKNGNSKTIVKSKNENKAVFKIIADYVTIQGVCISQGFEGISLYGAHYCNIFDNRILSSLKNGILLEKSNNNTLTDNSIGNNSAYGILLESSWNNNLANNSAGENVHGIYLHVSCNNNITNNTASHNRGYGISLVSYCEGNNLANNHTTSNAIGIYVENAFRNKLVNNNASSNEFGIYLKESPYNILTENYVSNNSSYGIFLEHSSSNNIYFNNFATNSQNAFSDKTNRWRSPEEISYAYNGNTYTNYLGNYWDDYKGEDKNGDGIGDIPYNKREIRDSYPLIESLESYVYSATVRVKEPIGYLSAKRKEEEAPLGVGEGSSHGIRGPSDEASRLIERQVEPPYPEWAQREGITGVVELKCWVLPSGEVSYVEVYRSSGWPRLDEHARQYLMKWKFEPIEEEKMQWGIVPFRFEFPFDLTPVPAKQKGGEESKGTSEEERSKTEVPVPTPSFFIQSNPPEASIYINGQSYGSTPKNIYNLEEGTYEIVLSKKGYKTYIKKVHLSLGDEIPIKIDLTPQKGNLIVISEPEGVDVYLDGVYQGKTKLTLEDVIATTHRVTFEKKGYYEEEKEVEVIYKETTTYKVALKEKPGSLHIISSPQGADVFLNGEYKAKSPLWLSSISPGEHKIKLTKQGRVPYYETVTIKGEQNITLDAILSPNNPPKIISLTTTSEAIRTQETIALTCTATDIDGNNLSYAWFTDKGSIQGQGQKVTYQAPDKPGTYLVRVEVIDNNGGKDIKEMPITVKEQTVSLKIISYPGGAKIYANEIYEGEAPLTLSNIEVGYYKVKAIKEEEVREKTVYARPKQITSLEFSFAPPPGMVFIPAGEFLMGSNSDYHKNPVHKVYLDAFYIDKYEVTNTQFCKLLNEKGNQEEDGEIWLNIEDESSLIECKEGKYQPKPGYDNHPVIMVTWYGARAYAKWAGKRLPTEAEWEKVARGGLIGKRYSWGDESPQQEERCNYRGYSGNLTAKMSPLLFGRKGTLPVGSFPPNSFGLHDMTGNVEEWCSDWSSSYFANPYKNPQGPSKGSSRILRGGSWISLNELDLNCANRSYADPHSSRYCLGFRCVKAAAE